VRWFRQYYTSQNLPLLGTKELLFPTSSNSRALSLTVAHLPRFLSPVFLSSYPSLSAALLEPPSPSKYVRSQPENHHRNGNGLTVWHGHNSSLLYLGNLILDHTHSHYQCPLTYERSLGHVHELYSLRHHRHRHSQHGFPLPLLHHCLRPQHLQSPLVKRPMGALWVPLRHCDSWCDCWAVRIYPASSQFPRADTTLDSTLPSTAASAVAAITADTIVEEGQAGVWTRASSRESRHIARSQSRRCSRRITVAGSGGCGMGMLLDCECWGDGKGGVERDGMERGSR
jgi:hypothetical protein